MSDWKAKKGFLVGGLILVILAGIGSGYLLVSKKAGGIQGSQVQKGMEVGSTDAATFKDRATGILEKGGIEGEGSHKLLREGGPSQTAYLTSSVIDLDQFIGHKVEVWGETFKGQKAGWLMDVGKVKVLE